MFDRLAHGYWFLIGLCVLEVGLSAMVGSNPPSSYFQFAISDMAFSIWIMPILLWYLSAAIALLRRRVGKPSRALLRLTNHKKGWLLRGALFLFLTIPAGHAAMTIKVAIPKLVPFYADPIFAGFDRALLGTDAWRLTHSLIGLKGTVFLDRIYIMWFVVVLGMLAWAAFTRDRLFQVRSLISYFLTWFLLGNVFAIALSSVGPCFYQQFYGSQQFTPLMEILKNYNSRTNLNAMFAMKYLSSTEGKEVIGAGISAMPSLHVSLAFLLFLMTREKLIMRRPRQLAFTYFLLIWIASVHLGWHYAVDGLVSVIGVSLIWWASGRFVAWLDARDTMRDAVALAATCRPVLSPNASLA